MLNWSPADVGFGQAASFTCPPMARGINLLVCGAGGHCINTAQRGRKGGKLV